MLVSYSDDAVDIRADAIPDLMHAGKSGNEATLHNLVPKLCMQ